MRIDKQTLRDLGIFTAEEDGFSVFELIDKTKTTGGKYRLRDMMLNPPDGLTKLKKQQDTLKYLAEKKQNLILPFSDFQMKSLETYLSTNIDIITNTGFLQSIRFCLTDIQAFRYLKNSIFEAVNFIDGYYRFLGETNKELPDILKKAYSSLESLQKDNDFLDVKLLLNKKNKAPFYKILHADRIIRTSLKKHIRQLILWYYDLDALLSMAKSTLELRFQFPEFTDYEEPLFIAEGLYHPLLKNAVPVNIKLNKEANFIFLTGPNMSGKTTFLKAASLAVYLAHLGMGVPAVYAKMNYFDTLLTSLNITDSIFTGYSFFYSEVKRIKQLAESLSKGERIFAVFDELFRGTNIKDAYDASIMIISGLALWNKSIFVLSSHLWEIWDDIKKYDNIKSLYFESEIVDNKPVFNYKLLPGVSNMRLGMYIIENEQIIDKLKQNNHDNN